MVKAIELGAAPQTAEPTSKMLVAHKKTRLGEKNIHFPVLRGCVAVSEEEGRPVPPKVAQQVTFVYDRGNGIGNNGPVLFHL